MRRLGTKTATTATRTSAKFERLERLAGAGVAVPEGLLTTTTSPRSPADAASFERLLAGGAVIVRGAFPGEDAVLRSAAGLSETVAGCRSVEEIEAAIHEIHARCHDRAVVQYFGAPPAAADVLIQREITRDSLVLVAARPSCPPIIEVHGSDPQALACGASPTFAGPLQAWSHPRAADLGALVERVLANVSGPYGVDIEAIIGTDGALWIVQARPLSSDPFPHWSEMLTALEDRGLEEGPAPDLQGLLVLDAEHNPAPLSIAHAWLIRQLGARRPAAATLRVLAGWLYAQTLPRDLGDHTAIGQPLKGLQALHNDLMPRARARHDALAQRLYGAAPDAILECLEAALDGFFDMFDNYVEVLIPARRGHERVHHRARPLSLRGRGDYLDVLPATWDLASPSLDELGIGTTLTPNPPDAVSPPRDLSDGLSEAEAATLLSEIDDHYFALGLMPLRRVWLAAGASLGVPPHRVFLLSGDELRDMLARREASSSRLHEVLETRARRHGRRCLLHPPERLLDGAPFPVTRPPLHGVPIGPTVEGTLTHRRDLEDLWRNPPAAGEILATPALTAPAAVALAESKATAICTEHGGALSHGALMARELGLSALIGCAGCTAIPEGSEVRLDTRRGALILLSRAP